MASHLISVFSAANRSKMPGGNNANDVYCTVILDTANTEASCRRRSLPCSCANGAGFCEFPKAHATPARGLYGGPECPHGHIGQGAGLRLNPLAACACAGKPGPFPAIEPRELPFRRISAACAGFLTPEKSRCARTWAYAHIAKSRAGCIHMHPPRPQTHTQPATGRAHPTRNPLCPDSDLDLDSK